MIPSKQIEEAIQGGRGGDRNKREVGNLNEIKRKDTCERGDPILPFNSTRIQSCNTLIYIFNIRTTI